VKARSDELQIFVCVIECGSISAAAEQVGQTPSAVSRTLSRLEAKLDTTLINRTTRRMDLTEEGKYFFEHAKLILDQMDQLEERLSSRQQTPSGRLRINAASPFMLHAIVPYIDEFRRLYPDIQLELNSNDLIIDLLEQSTDIAIRIGTLADSTLHARSLGCSPLHIVASPAYLEKHGTPTAVADLAKHTLLGFTQNERRSLADPGVAQRLQRRNHPPPGAGRPRHRQPVALHDHRRHSCRTVEGVAGRIQQRLSPADQRGVLPQLAAGLAHSVFPRLHPEQTGGVRFHGFQRLIRDCCARVNWVSGDFSPVIAA
jgi:DNA-binding transcriptional LysR family regulator